MWQGILGHDEVVERFRQILATGRLASTYLFVGPPGIGKRRFALALAHSLLCTESPDDALAPCGECESCRLFAAGNHPDLDVVGIRPDKSELIIGQFIGSDQNPKIPKEDALCHRMALKPFYGGRRVAIIDDADHFNVNSANCLLKTLEEPPPESLLVLVGTSPARQLPTIRSRSQIVRFNPLDESTIVRILIDSSLADEDQARRAASLSEGSVELAMKFLDQELWQFRSQLFEMLNSADVDRVRLARAVQAFVDEAGKEAPRRRERLKIILDFAVTFYRKSIIDDTIKTQSDPPIQALEACLAALEQVDRNANLALVIQVWSEAIATNAAGRRVKTTVQPV